MKKKVEFLLINLPYLLLSLVSSSIVVNALMTIFEPSTEQGYLWLIIQIIVFLLIIYFGRSFKKYFNFKNFELKKLNWVLLALALILIIVRAPIYFHVFDDFNAHIPGGYYAFSKWSNPSVLPMVLFDYLYPLLSPIFYIFIEVIGIRLTVLFFSLLQLTWFLNLNFRLMEFITRKKMGKALYVNLFFLLVFFIPELIFSHVTLMSDLYTLLFAGEVIFLFLQKNKNYFWLCLLSVLAILSKQSSGLFLIPMLAYLFLSNIKNITKKQWIGIAVLFLLVASFFIKTWLTTGNPLGGLMNSFFNSPLFPSENWTDGRWGPKSFGGAVTWPLTTYFNNRYMEFLPEMMPFWQKIIGLFFTIIPTILLPVLAIKKKKPLYVVSWLGIVLWIQQSGYGRYHLSLFFCLWILLWPEIIKYLPEVRKTWIKIAAYTVFAFYSLYNFRYDYAFRTAYIKFDPSEEEQIEPGFFYYYKLGLKQLGRDHLSAVYDELKNNFIGYPAIVAVDRDLATFYAFIAAYGAEIPIYTGSVNPTNSDIQTNKLISQQIKNNLTQASRLEHFLLVVAKDKVHHLPKSIYWQNYDCEQIFRNKQVSQFEEHENYFGYVEEYDCKLKP